METKELKLLVFVTLMLPLSFALADVSGAVNPFPSTQPSVKFRNTSDIWLRDSKLNKAVGVNEGAEITVDPAFLKKYLGTENPTSEQLQRFMLNPGKYMHAETFRNKAGRQAYDYFVPVTVRTADADPQQGKVALQYYNRMGQLDLIPPGGVSQQTTAYHKALIEQNRAPVTQAETCEACTRAAGLSQAPGAGTNLPQIRAALEAGARTSTNPLFARYQEFSRKFVAENRPITKARAGMLKRKFIKQLFDTFGPTDSATIIAALTGFAESPSRSSSVSQIAEIAAILKVIDNRAKNGYRTNSRVLRDLGIYNADPRMAAVLSDWQFSAWNDRDNMLTRMLSLTPDSGDTESNRRLAMAFETQQMMQNNQVQLLGSLGNSNMMHYHANYVLPDWARRRSAIPAIVRVGNVDVNLANQGGARHLFYTGIP